MTKPLTDAERAARSAYYHAESTARRAARGDRTRREAAAFADGFRQGGAAAIASALNVGDENLSLWMHHKFLNARRPTPAEINKCYDAADRHAAEFFGQMDHALGNSGRRFRSPLAAG
jgi:hypothetical protein